jgi:hypothetical protein
MGFLHPAMLLLAIVGIAILWLARRIRPPRVTIPAVAFLGAAGEGPVRAARSPPPSAWCAFAACALASVAAAGPRWREAETHVWVFDTSPAMAWKDATGRTRLDRARAAAARRLDAMPANTNILWRGGNGRWALEPAADLRRELAALTIAGAEGAVAGAAAEFGGGRSGLLFTGSEAPAPDGYESLVFGALPENVGILSIAPDRSGDGCIVVIGNAGKSARGVEIDGGGSAIRATLGPGEARAVTIPTIASPRIRLRFPDGKVDALALDDEAPVPAAGLRLELDPAVPEPLARALGAVSASRGTAGARSPRLRCVPLGDPKNNDSEIPRLEFASAARDAASLRRRAVTWGAGSPIHQLSLPSPIPAVSVAVDSPWIVDATDRASALAGLSGGVARLGLDPTDPTLAASTTFPVLVGALVDGALAASESSGLPGPAISMDPGPLEDRDLRARSEGAAGSRDAGGRDLAGAAALLALLAAVAAAAFAARRL